jgi:hypothetical protein
MWVDAEDALLQTIGEGDLSCFGLKHCPEI